jgi:intracellular sulfur oxidation DsrE/DsrF family protein
MARRRAAQPMISEQRSTQESVMTRFGHVMRLAAVCALSVFLAAPPAAAQGKGKELASTPTAQGVAKKAHLLILQVNTNEPAMMNLALNNATNVEQYYKDLGEKVEIEIVTFGPGLHMLRDDTSPVKDRLKRLKELAFPGKVQFSACNNTKQGMEKTEGKPVPIVSDATIVPSGVVRLMELQEQGWSYVRP